MVDRTTSATDAPVAAAAAAARARESHLQLAGEEHARYYFTAMSLLSAPSTATDNKVNDNGDGAMDDDINDNCDGASGDHDDEDATDNNVNGDSDGAADDNVDNDDGNRTTDGDRTMDNDVDDDGYGTTDDNMVGNCGGATDGHHCLDACGGCATKGDARRRHATSNATTSRQMRCKREESRQWTKGNRASIGQGCAF